MNSEVDTLFDTHYICQRYEIWTFCAGSDLGKTFVLEMAVIILYAVNIWSIVSILF